MGLFSDANIWLFLFSFFPGLIYSFIIYLNTPYKSIRLKTAGNYLFIGFLSAIFVLGFHILFPNWNDLLFLIPTPNKFGIVTLIPSVLSFFLQAFVQVALIEELSKFISFKIGDSTMRRKNSPLGTMFYVMMTGTGFAILENLLYGLNYGEQILLVRSLTSLVVHMTLGIFMGYFIALGKEDTSIKDKTVFHLFLKRNPKWKRTIYNLTGVLFATIIHGFYDWNLFIRHDNQILFLYIMIAGCVFASYKMGKRLLKIHNNSIE